MSQRTVELVIGKLATDEGFLRRFAAGRETALAELTGSGQLPLTPVELQALLALDVEACASFAEKLDPRLHRVCCRRSES